MTRDQFRTLRLKLGHTQTTLAKALGISLRSVQRIEGGDVDVSKRTELAIKSLKARPSTLGQ